MRRSARVPVALVLAASPVAVTLPACDASTDPAASDPIALGTDDPPFRGAWQTVHSGPFIPLLPDGSVAIEDLVIGRTTAFDGNFENRGDVIVEFDAEPGTIAIELRPFAAAPSSIDSTFARPDSYPSAKQGQFASQASGPGVDGSSYASQALTNAAGHDGMDESTATVMAAMPLPSSTSTCPGNPATHTFPRLGYASDGTLSAVPIATLRR